jgi:predicted transcriptional regulator
MAKKNFLLLSMEEDRINKVANVVSNKSCKKILDYLAGKDDATETELAQKLGIPLSTIHYNLKQLMDAGLIDAAEYHYSAKGREVFHYTLANKYIIITPKKTSGIASKLRSILPSLVFVAGASLLVQYFAVTSQTVAVPESAPLAKTAAEDTLMAIQAPAAAVHVPFWQAYPGLWLFLGAVLVTLIYLAISASIEKKRAG